MTQPKSIAVIGAGVVGLSVAIWLQRTGQKVTVIERALPGEGTSSGNAGVFADYARLPFSAFYNLRGMPRMLMDPEGPLSIQPRYVTSLMHYGLRFVKACSRRAYMNGRSALTALQSVAPAADDELLSATNARDLVRHSGCLALVGSAAGLEAALAGHFRERREQGVRMQVVSAGEVAELEPGLEPFHAGGVYYPDTRHTVDPLMLSRRYAKTFADAGGRLLRTQVIGVSQGDGHAVINTGESRQNFDHVVLCAGYASADLARCLGLKVPLASERGYHLMINASGRSIQRPVVWLDKATFLTPMEGGIRVAGTAEFAYPDAPQSAARTKVMLSSARRMLGTDPEVLSTWVGSRPSTPDSLPVIGPIPGAPSFTTAFGHGHLGLTLAAVTGKLVSESVRGLPTSIDLSPFLPDRFG